MLRTVVASLVLCLALALGGTAATGRFWISLLAMAGALVLGATALCLARPADDEEEDGVAADVHPLARSRRLPGSAVPVQGRGRAA